MVLKQKAALPVICLSLFLGLFLPLDKNDVPVSEHMETSRATLVAGVILGTTVL